MVPWLRGFAKFGVYWDGMGCDAGLNAKTPRLVEPNQMGRLLIFLAGLLAER
jgi:hypothetical protein